MCYVYSDGSINDGGWVTGLFDGVGVNTWSDGRWKKIKSEFQE